MISISKHAGIYTLKAELELPISLDEAWEFFSNPGNLEKITPKSMQFKISSGSYKPMYAGQIITYHVSPFPGFKTNWVTEITQVKTGHFFVDEQRFGPYSMWHHEHFFEAIDGGVRMTDKVSYKLPLGLIGHFAHHLFVRQQLQNIFNHRKICLTERFKK
ncbi:SRPBCC family protein [uncultured Sunxiuqinia sp.]|uniref:SRPBCC family protein n=1 Tax=uncultured Sunxiuqinia sp. TaxID=1573825 RepID=UPI002626B852|nr:SRPBCC family protein [uncultured Sunxiuqinia sp.]